MTVQPELDLANGLVPGLPFKGKYGTQLEVNSSNCLATNSKLQDIPKSVHASCSTKGSGVSKTDRVAFMISIDDGVPFNPLTSLASRRTYFVDGDERYENKRKALVNAARIAVANGVALLPAGYSLDDLDNLKGFRWAPKAGCSMCPCSPAFMSPLLVNRRGERFNWIEGVFQVRDSEEVATILEISVLGQLEQDPILNPVA
jgi:hypothetical protein